MRPRTRDHHLPRHVYCKRGTYYFVRGNKWVKIGCNEAEAIANAPDIFYKTVENHEQILHYAMRLVAIARNNAKGRRGIPFSLTKEDMKSMLDRCGWKCSVTSTPFSLEKIANQRPYAPSIDRINCNEGYHAENCRIVCVAANYAMNVWGEGVLRKIAGHMLRAEKVLGASSA